MNSRLIILSFFIVLLSCSNNKAVEYKNYLSARNPEPDSALSELMKIAEIDINTVSIFIDKSDFHLQIRSGDKIIKTYPVVFGSNTIDDKLKEGDKCTPEGIFKIRDLYPHKKWNKFLWLNYPTDESYKKHNQAKQNGDIKKNLSIGGEIGIHGVPNNNFKLIDDMNNWTLGCISLKNEHVDEIYEFVKVGTVVTIQK